MRWNTKRHAEAPCLSAAGKRTARLGLSFLALMYGAEACRISAFAQEAAPTAQSQYDHAVASAEKAQNLADYSEVIDELRRVIGAEPQWPSPYFTLGSILVKAGQPLEAAKALRTYLTLQPNAQNADRIRQLIGELEAKSGAVTGPPNEGRDSPIASISGDCVVKAVKVDDAIVEGRLEDAAELARAALSICHATEIKDDLQDTIRKVDAEIAERRRRASFPLREKVLVGAPPGPVFGLDVDNFNKLEPSGRPPEEIQEQKRLLRTQLRKIGMTESQLSSAQDQAFILNMTNTENNLDMMDRMFADSLGSNPESSGTIDLAFAQELKRLKGNRFDILDCYGAAADFCLVMLEKGETVAGKVRLLGPYIHPQSIERWRKLAEPGGLGNRIQSLEIFISTNDPVPLLSYTHSNVQGWLLHSEAKSLRQYLLGERMAFEIDYAISQGSGQISVVEVQCANSKFMFESRCHSLNNYASSVAGIH